VRYVIRAQTIKLEVKDIRLVYNPSQHYNYAFILGQRLASPLPPLGLALNES